MQALPLFEIYQNNFNKYKNILSEMIESYQIKFSTQPKEKKSVLLKEMGLNLIKMESSITQMESQIIFELIPDEKKKLKDRIEKNRNIVKQYEREIKDLKNKEQSILNDNNMANNTKININKSKNKTNTYLNFLQKQNPSNENKILNEPIDTMLFIDNKNTKNFQNTEISNEEMNLQRDETIKRRKFERNNKENDFLNSNKNNEHDIFLSNNKNNKNNNIEDKDKQDNKYKLNKTNKFKNAFAYGIRFIKYILKKIIDIILVLYGKLMHYLRHKYGQAATNRIIIIFCAILFIIIYAIIIYKINKNKIERGENIGFLKNITKVNSRIVKNSKIENTSKIINDTDILKKKEINTSLGNNNTVSEQQTKNEIIMNNKTDPNNMAKVNNTSNLNNNIDMNNTINLNNANNENKNNITNDKNFTNDKIYNINSNLTNNTK